MIFQNQKLVPLKTFVELPTIHFAIVWTLDLEWELEKKVHLFQVLDFLNVLFFSGNAYRSSYTNYKLINFN